MKRILSDLLKGVGTYEVKGSDHLQIVDLQLDSRKVKRDTLFVALKGSATDGHKYISQAIENGASAVLCQEWPEQILSEITYVKVKYGRIEVAKIAANFFDHPSTKLKCVGVTGTNGKTTIATLLYSLFKELGYEVGLVSTIEILVKEERIPSSLTTPDVISMHRLLSKMVDAGCSHVFMEVSSHAVDQLRIAEIQYAGGVFTNITHDHLDYHGTFAAYIKVKQSFFTSLSEGAFALTNEDDKNGRVMLEHTKAHRYGYSLRTLTDFKGKVLSSEEFGTYVEFDGKKLMTRLVGKFNVYNLLAVYSVARLLEELDNDEVLIALSALREVKGRMEVVAESPRVIVDYAHTPDALSNVLKTIRDMSKKAEIITVVGCGGDRDISKRPVMCKVAIYGSDRVILTSDNPRSEDPNLIISDMLNGINEKDARNVLQIVDRKSAIQTAIALSKKNTIILIAGKGHEEYQEIKGERFFFSDQKIVKDILSKDI